MSRVMLVAVSLAAALSLAGCGADGGTPDSAPAPAAEPSTPAPTSAGASPTPSPAPSTTEQSAEQSAAPSRPAKREKVGELAPLPRAAADAHLLDPDRMPRFGGRTWKLGSGSDPGAVGACQKTELETIGALEAVSRRFTADRGGAAVQVVARFPDAKTAWRAHRVLVAWRDDCEQRVRDSTVGPITPVTVRTGKAESYVGSFRARSAGLGILRSGTYLTLVEIAAGREAYPTRWDPSRVALRRIARTF